ncbi:hypothetical protein B0O80DRAFT_465048 [Mortierella sp. GBAus27b]|nr:hypothetical protein B0O80DRAFT_465048 [Mortierella sp. GBAus27b]
MGVKGAWPFLKKHGIEGSPVDVKSLDTRIHVDALSIIRAYILATDYHIRKDLYWKRLRAIRRSNNEADILDDEFLEELATSKLHSSINSLLLKHFRQSHAIIHVDGLSSSQKALARGRREEIQDKALSSLQLSMYNISRLVDQIQPSTVVTRSQKDKLVREAKQAQYKWKAARELDDSMKQELVDELQDLGWDVCWCEGEADLCISSQPGPVTVATADSDFLFHNVDTVLPKQSVISFIFDS